ncbi:MAG: 50S ribosomal protein L31 [Candidatus Amesbacteria bacterium GW2011_GWB1_47_19]|nr:MAG: 50S ribosomal protein L31 [Candidatus Amesbacteria bacterium GW2011_GWA1_44_24]KKU31604.1 MAG: 50S ribosomal protein L31 [Candidatus Amesbacteria bacterium GW2011_GWC1_46_24]KKU67377.1 MAG: 50S ribosomal protein L31 [Candidatus Amesbacteria bacterium GW2011_GWB1_47_19]OGD05407.1 MAG: 50S ribosomal protein L31 [Candidatus Amesbacteria bacterium RIFOXYB1_FULL_47_13]HBC72573.1 50S ribosomal protein L31 [Candidatus Amesbacteria bacterium]
MKLAIHPKYYQAVVKCACGNAFTVGSTKPEIHVEICAKCHPFFTGEMRFVDTMGRVERFQQTLNKTQGKMYISKKQKQLLKRKQEEAEDAARPKSLKEMFDRVKEKI